MNKKLILTFLFPLLIFSPSLLNFFSSDDWFHLRLAQITNFTEFANFFSFTHTDQSASFYRPLSTQAFFFISQKMAGLNAIYYHLFVLASFTLLLYLIYLQGVALKVKKISLLAVFLYGISVTNFTRLYFLSAYQEILMTIFVLLALITYKNKLWASLIFFILALMSKETAIVLPALLLLIYPKSFKKLPLFLTISAIYLYLRFFIFKGLEGDSYLWDFSPIRAANTLFWYTLWSFGAPEFLVDYVGSGLRPIARFYTDFPVWSYIILTSIFATLGSFSLLLIKSAKKIDKNVLIFAGWFIVSLLPVLFLPWHKFTLELGLPLVGFSFLLAYFIFQNKKLGILFLSIFIIFNLLTNYLTYSRHYSVNRGKMGQAVISYLEENYKTYPSNSYFEFINDTGDYGAEWGSSKQIRNAISSSDLFRVFYKDNNIQVFYEDYPEDNRPTGKTKIELSTRQFIR